MFLRPRADLSSRSRSNRNRRTPLRHSRRLFFETLEVRRVLTSTLYVDFGDNFPAAGLVGTIGDLKTDTSGVAGDPAVSGPDMDGDTNGDWDIGAAGAANDMDDADGFNLVSFVDRYTADNGMYPGGLAQLRADIMTFVRRFYEPFDIDVIELTAAPVNVNGRMVAGANDLDDISSTLGANEAGVAKNNDAYVLLGAMVVHRPAADGGDFDPSSVFGGYASVIDMPASNNSDNTAIGYLGPGALANVANDGFWGNLIAHEAGHLFGLQHSLTQAPGGTVSPLIPTSEIMSYLGANGYNFFSRYPQVRGNNNTMNNDDLQAVSPPAPAAQRTPHDQWLNTASIGQNTDFHYVTGTGANDIITITNAGGGNATVSVQAFSANTYAAAAALAVPGSAGASTNYTYTLALDRPFIIDGGDLNDRIILDGDLGFTMTVRGMNGVDELIVMGKNAASGTYTPGTNTGNGLDGNPDLRGAVVIGSTTINFQEFEPTSLVTVQDVTSFSLITPAGQDLLSFDSAAGSPARNQITGTSAGVGIVPLTFFNVASMNIDTGANSDTVTVDDAPVAAGLQNLTVSTGAGFDILRTTLTNYALPVAGGAFTFQGGSSSDEIEATANVSFNLSDTSLAIVGDSSIVLIGVEEADLTGGGNSNTFTVSNWTGTADLNGVGSDDAYIINFTGAGNGNVVIEDTGGSGTDTVEVNGTAGDDTLSVTSTQVALGGETVNYEGVESLTVNAAAGDDTINVRSTFSLTPVTVNGGDDDDTINVGNLFDSLDDIESPLTVNGNAPASPTPGDVLNMNDQGSANGRTYLITATTVQRDGAATITYGTIESLTVNGASGNNTINIQSTASITPVTINAGAGDDNIAIDSNGDTVGGTVDNVLSQITVNGQGGTNTLYLEDFDDLSTMVRDIIHVTPTEIGADASDSFFGSGGSLAYSNLAHVTLNLSNQYAPDEVHLIPSTDTSFELHGNDPDCPLNPDQLPGDALFVDFTGVTDPLLVADGAGNATWTFGNREDVAFDGFEKLNHVGIIVIAPDNGQPGIVRVFDAETGALRHTFAPFGANFRGGVRVAVGDMNCDGLPDIITAAGPSRAPEVRVFNGVTGVPFPGTLGSFLAYGKGSKAGVWVAAGDINQDGLTDIVTGPDNGGGPPVVKVFSGLDGALHTQFMAYDTFFNGGVRVAVGDINGDSIPDIVTAPGKGRQPQVRVFDGTNLNGPAIHTFMAFAANFHQGLYLAVGDMNGDGRADIVASGGQRLVRVFDGTNPLAPALLSFEPFGKNGGDTLRIAAADVDNDGDADLVVVPSHGKNNEPTVFEMEMAGPNLTATALDDFFASLDGLTDGLFVAAGG